MGLLSYVNFYTQNIVKHKHTSLATQFPCWVVSELGAISHIDSECCFKFLLIIKTTKVLISCLKFI